MPTALRIRHGVQNLLAYRGIIHRDAALDDATMLKESAAKLAAFHQSEKAVKH